MIIGKIFASFCFNFGNLSLMKRKAAALIPAIKLGILGTLLIMKKDFLAHLISLTSKGLNQSRLAVLLELLPIARRIQFKNIQNVLIAKLPEPS